MKMNSKQHKTKIVFTCSNYVQHAHRLYFTAWLCGRVQLFIHNIVTKYDLFVYRLAYRSLYRLCVRNNGNAYLMFLYLEEWLRQHPLNEQTKRETEDFYATQGVVKILQNMVDFSKQ